MRKTLNLLISALLLSVACAKPPAPRTGSSSQLAVSNEHSVTVTIFLELDSAGQAWLAATFSPDEPGYHLYSMDLPRAGLDGLGRPTLLELVPGSHIQAAGPLSASIAAGQGDGPEGLLVYPAGPVTLRLRVRLPQGEGPFDGQVSLTYMACSGGTCLPPVEGKLIPFRLPGDGAY